MTTKDAFKLAGLIGQSYIIESSSSTSINDLIARTLGADLYKKFCKEIGAHRYGFGEESFQEGFVDTPLEEEFWINDKQVSDHYHLDSIMDALAKVVT